MLRFGLSFYPKGRWGHPFVSRQLVRYRIELPGYPILSDGKADNQRLGILMFDYVGGNDSEQIAKTSPFEVCGCWRCCKRIIRIIPKFSFHWDLGRICSFCNGQFWVFNSLYVFCMWKWVETVNMPWHGLLPHSFNCDPPAAQGTTPCPLREGPSPNVLMPIKVGCMTPTLCFPILYSNSKHMDGNHMKPLSIMHEVFHVLQAWIVTVKPRQKLRSMMQTFNQGFRGLNCGRNWKLKAFIVVCTAKDSVY